MSESLPRPSPFPPGVFLANGFNTDPPLPADDPTTGNRLNHLCIRVRDPLKSLNFYIKLMGMRTVFVINAGPMTVYFLGYPLTERHRQNLRAFGEETLPQTTAGLLELFHIHGSEAQPEEYYQNGNNPPHLGFCHLGFCVRDVKATVERLKANGVEVLRYPQGVPITEWENERGVGVQVKGTDSEFHSNYIERVQKIAFAKDPVSLRLHQRNVPLLSGHTC
jgi:lactoylglutathione lyase